jgi:hypothetical protein
VELTATYIPLFSFLLFPVVLIKFDYDCIFAQERDEERVESKV